MTHPYRAQADSLNAAKLARMTAGSDPPAAMAKHGSTARPAKASGPVELAEMDGKKSGKHLGVAHRARGGRTKGKVVVNVMVPQSAPPLSAAMASPGLMHPPMPAAAPAPMAAPPMGVPGAGMPPGMGLPIRRAGGRAFANGGKVEGGLGAKPAKGFPDMNAGAATGEGRIEKSKAYGLKPAPGKGGPAG